MPNGKFLTGAVVRLKSGGETMTVSVVKKDFNGNPTGDLSCRWFDGKKLQKDLFHEDVLIVADQS